MSNKVAFVIHMLAPYRVSFYKKLFAHPEFEWKLFAGYKTSKNDARPQFEGTLDLDITYFNEAVTRMGVYNMLDYPNMFEAVSDYNPDIIIMFAHVGTRCFRRITDWARSNNKKVVMWTCFWEPDYITPYKRVIRNYFIRNFYNKADYHITYSSLARQKLIDIGFPEQQIAIAYNGVDLEQYQQDLDRPTDTTLMDPNAINLLYVGGFGKDKKVELLIKAMQQCRAVNGKPLKAYLIGDGPTFDTCRQLVTDLNLNNSITLLGRLSKEVGRYLKAADFIVLPGTGGLILNEAILFEKPFIVSDADGTEYDLLINGFNGVKFLAGSAPSLANAIKQVAEQLSYFQANAAQAAPVVTRRSNVNYMTETFISVLNKLVHEHHIGSRRAAQLHENSPHYQGH